MLFLKKNWPFCFENPVVLGMHGHANSVSKALKVLLHTADSFPYAAPRIWFRCFATFPSDFITGIRANALESTDFTIEVETPSR